MNLFKQQKFSIRKFNIGTFSALIATVAFLTAQPHQADAAENQPKHEEKAATSTSTAKQNAEQTAPQSATPANNDTTTSTTNNDLVHSAETNKNSDQTNQNTPDNHQSSSETDEQTSVTKQTEAQNNAEQTQTNRNVTPADKSVKDNQTEKVNKRSKRDVAADQTPPAAAAPANAQSQDPHAENAGPDSTNMKLTFEDPSIQTNPDRKNPSVTVTDNVPGYTLINHGKVGFVNADLTRTDMFDNGNPKNYQAEGNVLALGRVQDGRPNDHGDFNGISKQIDVKPKSELVFEFSTMTSNGGQDATNFVIKNAADDSQLSNVTVNSNALSRRFVVPEGVEHLNLQFLPDNAAIADASRITANSDGYKYYSFIDNVGIYSGSHLYIKNRDLAATATNQSEYTMNAEIANNGNYSASLAPNKFSYTVKLPQGVSYVDQSLTTAFPNGNGTSEVLKPMTVNYDNATNTVTFTSQGVTTNRGTHAPEVLLPEKSLKLTYKVRVDNVPTPQQIDFKDTVVYQTAFDTNLSTNNAPEVTLVTDPYHVNVVMNKAALQNQVDTDVNAANYTTASIAEYNKLKQQAQTILTDEHDQSSQADIDSLVQRLQAALIDDQEAVTAVKEKAKEMLDAANTNQQLTQEEITKITQKIQADRDDALNLINQQTTSNGVTTQKDAGIAKLSADTATPVVKPEAKKAIADKAAAQKQLIQNNNDATNEEKATATQQVDDHLTEINGDIDSASNNDTVNVVKTDGLNKLNADNVTPVAKPQAKAAILEKYNAKVDSINNDPEATTEEKEPGLTNALNEKNNANQQIDGAHTNSEVEQAKTAGIQAIDNVHPTITKKSDAKNTITQKATQQKLAIQANNDATNEEKATANSKVDQAVTDANTAIDQAQNNQSVDQAVTDHSAIIGNIAPETTTKQQAKDAVAQKVAAQKAIIQNYNQATTEEKTAADNKVDAAKTEADTNIQNAQSEAEVNQAKQTAIEKIELIAPDNQVKTAAKKEIQTKTAEQQQVINGEVEATTEEKQEALTRLETEKETALNAISQASAENDVANAKNAGVAAITQVHPTARVKEAARNAIVQAVTVHKQQIKGMAEPVNEEKTAANQAISTAETQALKDLQNVSTNQEVNDLQTNTVNKINQIQPEATARANARQAVTEAATAQKNTIQNNQDATDEEKATAVTKVNTAEQDALNSLTTPTTAQDLNTAKDAGIAQINAVTVVAQSKPSAKAEINQKATQQKQANAATQNATTEEIAAADQAVDAAKDAALQAITDAHTTQEVVTAKDNGIQTINNIHPTVTKKADAKAEVATVYNDRKQAISNNHEATQEEQQTALTDLDTKKQQAENSIDQATTNDEVDTAKIDGLNALSQVKPATAKKTEAKVALDQKANERKMAIGQMNTSTTDEQQAANAKVDQALATAHQAIDAAVTNNDVDQAKATHEQNINNVQPEALVKPAAKSVITQKVQEQTTAIDNNNQATTEEKDTAKQRLQTAKTDAESAIDQAQSNADVEAAKNAEIAKIEAIQPETATKTTAKQALQTKANERKAAIAQTADITAEEQAAANQLVDEQVNQGNSAIDNADTQANVTQAQTNAENAINQVQPTVTKKQEARTALEQKAAQQKQTNQGLQDATDEEKTVADVEVDAEIDKAKQAIANATTNAQVDEAKDAGIAAVDHFQPKVRKKRSALDDIDQKEQAQTAVINQNQDATTEEKQAALQQLTQAVANAKAQINAATTNDQVDDAQRAGDTAIAAVQPATQVKTAAKQDIDTAVTNQNNAIDGTADATTEEKDAAKALVEQAKQAGYQNITNAAATADVDTAKTQAVNNINSITADTTVKSTAKDELTQQANTKKNSISNDSSATIEEQKKATQQVDTELQNGLQNIGTAQSINDVTHAQNTSSKVIANIQPETQIKDNAKQALQQVLDQKTNEINQTPDTTAEEKEAAISQATLAFVQGINDILQARTEAQVNQAKTESENNINKVTITATKKPAAKNDLTTKADQKRNEIAQTPNTPQAEIDEAKQVVSNILDNAKQQIDQANTNNEVDQIVDVTSQAIQDVKTLGQLKTAALNDIEQAATKKNEAIDAIPNTTTNEVAAAKQQVEQLKQAAIQTVNQATTRQEIADNTTAGINSITQYQPTFAKKHEATLAIYAAADKQQEAINATPNATQEEKQMADDKVDTAVRKALKMINDAVDNNDVEDATTQGEAAIQAVQATPQVKPAALSEVEQAKQQATERINQTADATQEEKATATNDLQQIVANANEAINQAITDSAVEQAKVDGVEHINNLTVPATHKPQAIQVLDQAAQQQNDRIKQEMNATQEEKAAATAKVDQLLNDAKAAVNQATDNTSVENAKQQGVSNIENVQVDTKVKPVALKKFEDSVEELTNTFNQTPDATTEEKATAVAKLQDAVTQAKAAIKQAEINADVEQAVQASLEQLRNINVTVEQKPQAFKAITDSAATARDAVNNNADLTDEEKEAMNDKIDTAVIEANEAIYEATDNAGVATAKQEGLKQIEAIEAEAVTKPNAIAVIDALANKLTETFNQTPDATSEEKDAALNKLNDAVQTAKTAIAKANTSAEVQAAKKSALNTLDNLKVTVAQKPQARQDIKDAADTARQKANTTADTTVEEKEKVAKDINAIVRAANGDINAENKEKAIKAIVDNTLAKLKQATAKAMVKPETRQFIQDKVNAQKETINDTANATKEAKNKALQQLDKVAKSLDEKLAVADTNEAVMTVKKAAAQEIEAILPEVFKQEPVNQDRITPKDPSTPTGNGDSNGKNRLGDNKGKDNDSNKDKPSNQDDAVGQMKTQSSTEMKGSTKDNKQSSEQHKLSDKQPKQLPNTGGNSDYDLPLAELTLGAGMAFLIRRFTKRNQESE